MHRSEDMLLVGISCRSFNGFFARMKGGTRGPLVVKTTNGATGVELSSKGKCICNATFL